MEGQDIYGAAAAAARGGALASLAALQQQVAAEPEQMRVWRTPEAAKAASRDDGVALADMVLGERYFARDGELALLRMSPDTIQLSAVRHPMEPLTCTLPAAVVAAAGRVEAARERAGKAEKMLASASSLPQIEAAHAEFKEALALDPTSSAASTGSARAKALLQSSTAVAPPGAAVAPPSALDGLGADELSRVAQRLQGELLELRTVVERLEADKKQVVGMYRALERDHAELVTARTEDAATIESLRRELATSRIENERLSGLRASSYSAAADRTAGEIALLDSKAELTPEAARIFTGWFQSALAAGPPHPTEGGVLGREAAARLFSAVTAVALSVESLPIERLFEEYAATGRRRARGGQDAEEAGPEEPAAGGPGDGAGGSAVGGRGPEADRGRARPAEAEQKQVDEENEDEGLVLEEYLRFYRDACRKQPELVRESIGRMRQRPPPPSPEPAPSLQQRTVET